MGKFHRRGNAAVHVRRKIKPALEIEPSRKEIEALDTKAGYVFVFTWTETCFLQDGLAELISNYEAGFGVLEDGEKEEIEFAKALATRIGKRLGIE